MQTAEANISKMKLNEPQKKERKLKLFIVGCFLCKKWGNQSFQKYRKENNI